MTAVYSEVTLLPVGEIKLKLLLVYIKVEIDRYTE